MFGGGTGEVVENFLPGTPQCYAPELSGCDDQDETGWVNILSWRGLGGFPAFLMIQIQLTAAGEGRDVFFSGLTASMDPGFL